MQRNNYVHPLIVVGKRIFDLIGASVGLLITLPLFPFIMLAIKLTSPGPIFLYQTRVGRIWPSHTEIFMMIKL